MNKAMNGSSAKHDLVWDRLCHMTKTGTLAARSTGVIGSQAAFFESNTVPTRRLKEKSLMIDTPRALIHEAGTFFLMRKPTQSGKDWLVA